MHSMQSNLRHKIFQENQPSYYCSFATSDNARKRGGLSENRKSNLLSDETRAVEITAEGRPVFL